MPFWHRQTHAGENTDYSAVASAVRARRNALNDAASIARDSAPVENADVRSYRPVHRLQDRDAQTQKLVENAREIPRTWDPEEPICTPPSVGDYVVQLCICFTILGFSIAIAFFLCAATHFNRRVLLIPVIGGMLCAAVAAVITLWKHSRRPTLHIVEVCIALLILLGILLSIRTD